MSGDSGQDLVTDFSLAEGDRVMVDADTAYSVEVVGSDTVITLETGAKMVLAGVSVTGASPDWIFSA